MYQLVNAENELNQRQKVALVVGGVEQVYEIQVRWQKEISLWTMNVWNEEGDILATQLPMLSGVSLSTANIAKPLDYVGFGEVYVMPRSDEDYGTDPASDNLHSKYGIVWGDEE